MGPAYTHAFFHSVTHWFLLRYGESSVVCGGDSVYLFLLRLITRVLRQYRTSKFGVSWRHRNFVVVVHSLLTGDATRDRFRQCRLRRGWLNSYLKNVYRTIRAAQWMMWLVYDGMRLCSQPPAPLRFERVECASIKRNPFRCHTHPYNIRSLVGPFLPYIRSPYQKSQTRVNNINHFQPNNWS